MGFNLNEFKKDVNGMLANKLRDSINKTAALSGNASNPGNVTIPSGGDTVNINDKNKKSDKTSTSELVGEKENTKQEGDALIPKSPEAAASEVMNGKQTRAGDKKIGDEGAVTGKTIRDEAKKTSSIRDFAGNLFSKEDFTNEKIASLLNEFMEQLIPSVEEMKKEASFNPSEITDSLLVKIAYALYSENQEKQALLLEKELEKIASFIEKEDVGISIDDAREYVKTASSKLSNDVELVMESAKNRVRAVKLAYETGKPEDGDGEYKTELHRLLDVK